MSVDISGIYNSMWDLAILNLSENKPECDAWLSRKAEDRRRGLTVVARLDNETLSGIGRFLELGKQIEPEQYFYDLQDIHVTVLSVISCYDGFKLDNINIEKYTDIIRQSICNIEPIEIEFRGITASPSCIMVKGFPKGKGLETLRNSLRTEFGISGLETSIDKRYPLRTAHSTIIRFTDPFINKDLFIEHLMGYREYGFGITRLEKLELCFNDWYMSSDITRRLETFELLGKNL